MTHVVEILSRAEETLEKLHRYYKFGRHLGIVLDELYSWLAHCAHLVFSLRLAEEAGLSGATEGNPHLASLVAGLDFTPFHYLDFRRRVFYWSAYQEYLKAEPRWFSLWVKILEKSERLSVSDLAEFHRLTLTRVGHGGPTDRKMSRKNDIALMRLLRTGPGGRIIASSMYVLEDMASALISFVARADPATYAPAQLQSLAHLLRQVRRTVVWDGAAEGPYALQGNRAWGLPSTFAPLYFWRAPGLLRITPKDEGGEVTCTYTWNRRSKTWHRSWIRSTAALRQEYEVSLFGTWSYDNGECPHGTSDCAGTKACWVITGPEATHLVSVCRQADAILEKLAAYPAYGPLVEEATRLLRADESACGPRNLAWTHIRDLDQLVSKLECVCQETPGVAHNDGQNSGPHHAAPKAEPESRGPVHRSTMVESVGPQTHGRPEEIGSRVHSAGSVPDLADHTANGQLRGRSNPVEQRPEPASCDSSSPPESPGVVSVSNSDRQIPARPRKRTARVRNHTPSETDPGETSRLVARLAEHHRASSNGANRRPLSSKQLQRELQWGQSKVQRAMANVFGEKPFLRYREECRNGTILVFLLHLDGNERACHTHATTRGSVRRDPCEI